MTREEKYEATKYLAHYDVYRNGYYGKYQQSRFSHYISPITRRVINSYEGKDYKKYVDDIVRLPHPAYALHPAFIRQKKRAEKQVDKNFEIIMKHLIAKGFDEESVIEDAKYYYQRVKNNLICAYPNGEVIFEGVLYSKLYEDLDFKPFVDYAKFVLSYLSNLRIYNAVLDNEGKSWVDRSRHTPNSPLDERLKNSILYMFRKFNRDNSHFMIKYSRGNTIDELTKLMNWLVDEFVDFDKFENAAIGHWELFNQVLQEELLKLIESSNIKFQYKWRDKILTYKEFFDVITPPRWMMFSKLGVEHKISPRIFARAMYNTLWVKEQGMLLPDFNQWESSILNEVRKLGEIESPTYNDNMNEFEDTLNSLRVNAETKVLDILEEEQTVLRTITNTKEVVEEVVEEDTNSPAEVSLQLNKNDRLMEGFIEKLKELDINPDDVTEIVIKIN
jgi:hypothetical protein